MKDNLDIDWVFRKDGFRKFLNSFRSIPKMPDNAIGWTTRFWREMLNINKDELEKKLRRRVPDIEIYPNGINEFLSWYSDEIWAFLWKASINYVLIHELVHEFTGEVNEGRVDRVTNEALKDEMQKFRKIINPDAWLTWGLIPCPKAGHDITWIECLGCDDLTKDSSCPLQKIRIDAFQYKYETNKYHVSELCFPRYAYYNRTRQHSMAWDDYYDMLYGKALGWYIESKFAEHQREVEVEKNFGDFGVIGHADLVDDETRNLYEIKFYYDLKYLLERGAPNPDHEFQARAYWTLGLESKPYMFKKIQKIKIIYYGKIKKRGQPRRKELEVAMSPVDVETPARILHEALKADKPPKEKCPEWRCHYCEYKLECGKDE